MTRIGQHPSTEAIRVEGNWLAFRFICKADRGASEPTGEEASGLDLGSLEFALLTFRFRTRGCCARHLVCADCSREHEKAIYHGKYIVARPSVAVENAKDANQFCNNKGQPAGIYVEGSLNSVRNEQSGTRRSSERQHALNGKK